MCVKDPNEPQAMHKGLLKHKVQLVQLQSTTEMKGRIDVPDWDRLSKYGQDAVHLLIFVVKEMPVAPESVNHFLH